MREIFERGHATVLPYDPAHNFGARLSFRDHLSAGLSPALP